MYFLTKYFDVTFLFLSPPSSKCLHLFRGSCFLYLHTVHSKRSTIFLVVFAWTTKRENMEFEKPTHKRLILKKGHDRKKTREIEINTLLDYFLLHSPHLSVMEKLIEINLTALDSELFSSLTMRIIIIIVSLPGMACMLRYHGHVEW